MTAAVHADEWALVDRARTDPNAFAELYRIHRRMIYVFAVTRLNDHHLAEDITSETFLRAQRRLDKVTYQGVGFAAWLITIARNLIRDHCKSSRVRREVVGYGSGGDGGGFGESLVESIPEQYGPYDAVDAQITLHGCLAGASKIDREVLAHRYLHQTPDAEVSEEIGMTVGAIKAQRLRAIGRLRQRVADDGDLLVG